MFSKLFHSFKKDIRSIPIGIKLVVLMIFLRAFGWGFVDPYFSMYLNGFHENYAVIGFLTAIISVSALITIIPLMRLTDRVKETVLIRDGEILYFFVILAFVLAGMFTNILLLVTALFFSGIAQTLIVVGSEAYIRKHNGKGKSGPFGYYIALDYFGWILGMLIAAFTVQYYGFNSMFLFIAPSLLVSFFILPHIRERGIRSFFTGLHRYFHTKQDAIDIFNDFKGVSPKMIFFLILAFFDGAIRMFSYVFVPLFGLSINLNLRSIALLMAIMYAPFILSYFFSELSDRIRKMNVIAVGLFIGAFSFISLYFLVSQMWFIIFASAISLSLAIIRPAYNGAITRLSPRRMLGEVTGLNNLLDRLGRIVGPIVIGLIADAYGLETSFLLMAVISLGLGAGALVLRGYDYIVSPAN